MKLRVVVLGAGFGGLELTTILSEAIPDRLDLTLIDKNDSFIFGFSKLDGMFGRKAPEAVRLDYREIGKPGVTFRQETITAIDPDGRRMTCVSESLPARLSRSHSPRLPRKGNPQPLMIGKDRTNGWLELGGATNRLMRRLSD